jgi:hypothetical protein
VEDCELAVRRVEEAASQDRRLAPIDSIEPALTTSSGASSSASSIDSPDDLLDTGFDFRGDLEGLLL